MVHPVGAMSGMPPMPPMMMMEMSFDWSIEVTVLFKGWKTTNWWNYTLTLVAWFVICALFEGLQKFRRHFAKTRKPRPTADGLIQSGGGRGAGGAMSPAAYHAVLTALYVTQLTVSYLIMLVVMTYNVGLFIVCMLGYGLGFFLFAKDEPDAPAACHGS